MKYSLFLCNWTNRPSSEKLELLFIPLDHFMPFRHGIAMDFVDSARVDTLVTESEKKVFEIFESMVKSTGKNERNPRWLWQTF